METLNKEFDKKTNTNAFDNAGKNLSMSQSVERLSHRVGSEIGSVVAQVNSKAESYLNDTRSYVAKKPLQSVAIAAATGVVAGGLLTFIVRRQK